jgi:photosystem II stability/assembly factor-like uncharacterized protein
MDNLRQRFATLDRVPVPEVWSEVERRLEALGGTAPTGRLVAVRPEWRVARAERSRRASTPIRGRRKIALLAAAMVIAVALVGGALAVGSGLVRLPSVVPPALDATPAITPTTSPAEATPSPSLPASSAIPVGLPASPDLITGLRDWRLVSDAVGWVATSSAVHRTTDRGLTWTDVRPRQVTSSSVTAFVDADTMYLASGTSPATIAATHDGGVSWVEATLEVGAVSGGPVFTFRAPMRGFATFYDPDETGPLRVFATTDGGVTWTGPTDGSVPHMAASSDKLSDPFGGFLWQRAGKLDNKPFDNRFFLSADGAASWTEYRFPTGPLAPKDALKEIVDIVQDDGGPITMAIMVNGGEGAVYEATADPATWRLVRTLPGPDVQILSSTTWVVVSTHTEFRSTVDAGEHWRIRATSTPFRERPRFATPDDGWVIVGCNPDSILPQDRHCDGATKETMLLITSDGGATWTRIVH